MKIVSPVKPQGLRRRLVAGAAIVTAAALVLTGCAAGSSSSTTAAAGKTLTIAVPSYPSSWDQDFVAFDPIALALYKNVYPYLVDYGTTKVGSGTIQDTTNIMPAWAKSFTSTDGKLWTLKLRKGATFKNGDPITATDVKWSKDRAFAAKANVAGVYALIGLTKPDQIKVVDKYTVTFDQAYASALSPQIQAISLFIYDSKLMKKHATASDPWAKAYAAKTPSDGGLYNVSKAVSGQSITLKANKKYPAGDGPKVDTIILKVVSDAATESSLLRSGDVDIAMGLGTQQIADLKGVKGVKTISAPSNQMISIPLDVDIAPFNNVLVREAVADAIPYKQIISSVYNGDARLPKSVVPIDMPGYTKDGFPYDTDLAKAKKLMTQAGVTEAKTELVYASGNDEQEQIAVIVQAALAKIGITVTPTPLDSATLGDRRAAKDIPMQITSGQQWVNDVEYLMAQWTTGAYLNYGNYSNAAVDSDVAESHTVTDTAKRLELWKDVQAQFAKDVPVIPIAQPNYNLPVRSTVSGFVQPVDGLIRLKYLTISK